MAGNKTQEETQQVEEKVEQETPTSDPRFSYDLLRHALLPELLGKDEEAILYWAGKSLARKYPLTDFDEMQRFFYKAQWGVLKKVKEKKHETLFELSSTNLTAEHAPVSLECGFLAEQIQKQTGFISEAAYELKKKKPLLFQIVVRWDHKDKEQ
ncbi:YslB family protein [Alteribacter aurantiacus]|uniref:YslB family protein n=1 Tax=Alteribacter aurantiacus TaxID=254410 RepID=UPI0004170D29|nr:YslB family protein [Alteribacter aurantiacus]